MNNKFKLSYINKWRTEIASFKSSLEKNEETIERMKSLKQFSLEYRNRQICLLKEKNEEIHEKIQVLEQNIRDVDDPLSDLSTKLVSTIEENTKNFREIEISKKNKKKSNKKTTLKKKEQEKFDKKEQEKNEKRNKNRSKRKPIRNVSYRKSQSPSIEYDLRKIYDDEMKMPQYMKDNLENMPENKGYIWRNSWYFGRKEKEPNQPFILFEKRKGNLLIHEITEKGKTIYSKRGRNRKEFVEFIPRRKI